MLADFVLLYFSSPVGLALLFLHPLFFTLTCLYRTLVSSLPWFFTVRVLVSSRHRPCSSLLASSASPGSQRRLFIAFSPPLCPAGSAEAGLCSACRGSDLLAIGECQLVDFLGLSFLGFRCTNKFLFFICCWIPVSFLTHVLQDLSRKAFPKRVYATFVLFSGNRGYSRNRTFCEIYHI